MFTAALFKIAKAWKQSKCPSAEELGKEDVVHTYGEILATRNEMMPFAATWMNLAIIILSEVSQAEKDKCHMILFLCEI